MQKSQFTNIINKSMVSALLKGYQLYDVGTIGRQQEQKQNYVLLKDNDVNTCLFVPHFEDTKEVFVSFVTSVTQEYTSNLENVTPEALVQLLETDITKSLDRAVEDQSLNNAINYMQQGSEVIKDAFLVSVQERLQASQRGR